MRSERWWSCWERSESSHHSYYLAGQISQNTRQLKVTTTAAVADSDIEISKLFIADPDLSRIIDMGMADRAALSDDEQRRFDAVMDMSMRTFQRNYYFAKDDAISSSLWEAERETNSAMFRSPGGLAWWAESMQAQYYGGEFRTFLDDVVRESELAAQQSAAADSARAE